MSEQITREEKKEQRKITISLILVIIGLLALLISVYFHTFYEKPQQDYNIPEVDVNVVELDKVKMPDGIDTEASGGYASVSYSKDIIIDLSDKTATFIFQNPSSSGSLMEISIEVNKQEIAHSGIIKPGFGINSSIEVDTTGLEEGTFDGNIIVEHYNPDTGEKSILSLKIPVTVIISL